MPQVVNKSKAVVLAKSCEMADSFYRRFCGLMLRRSLPHGTSLALKPCNSIHMLFMRFPIDVLFIDKDNVVVGCCKSIKPWRLSSIFRKSVLAVELPAGLIDKTNTDVGDIIAIEDD